MARPNTPKNWKLVDVDYRTRFLLYQMLTVPKAKDRNKDKAYSAVIAAIKAGEEDLLPALALDAELVTRFAQLLQAEGVTEAVVRVLAKAMKATKDSKERATIHLDKSDVETALDLYDEFLKEANRAEQRDQGIAVLARVENTHRVIPIIEALESAKAGTATPGLCEPVKLDGTGEALPPPVDEAS